MRTNVRRAVHLRFAIARPYHNAQRLPAYLPPLRCTHHPCPPAASLLRASCASNTTTAPRIASLPAFHTPAPLPLPFMPALTAGFATWLPLRIFFPHHRLALYLAFAAPQHTGGDIISTTAPLRAARASCLLCLSFAARTVARQQPHRYLRLLTPPCARQRAHLLPRYHRFYTKRFLLDVTTHVGSLRFDCYRAAYPAPHHLPVPFTAHCVPLLLYRYAPFCSFFTTRPAAVPERRSGHGGAFFTRAHLCAGPLPTTTWPFRANAPPHAALLGIRASYGAGLRWTFLAVRRAKRVGARISICFLFAVPRRRLNITGAHIACFKRTPLHYTTCRRVWYAVCVR